MAVTPESPPDESPRSLAVRLADVQLDMARLFDQTPSFMALVRGPEHRFEFTNPSFLRLIAHRSVIGQTVSQALPDAAAQGYLDLLNRAYASGEAFVAKGSPYRVQAEPDGPVDERFIDFVFQPIRDNDDQVVGIFIEGVDVTERVSAEETARVSRERLDLTLSGSGIVGIWSWDVPADRVVADERFAGLFGIDPDVALRGVPVATYLTGVITQDRERVSAEIQAALRDGGAYASEYRVRSERFGTRRLMARGRCELNLHGTPVRFPGIVIDITDQHQTYAALRESDTRLRLVIDGAKDHMIVAMDMDGIISTWSSGAETIFGWTASEAIGQSISMIFTPEDRAQGVDAHEIIKAATLGSSNDERWHLRKDGTRVFLNGSMNLLPTDDDGNPQGFMKVARDETDRRHLTRRRDALIALTDRFRELESSEQFGYAAAEALGQTLDVTRVGYGVVEDSAPPMLLVEREWNAPGRQGLPARLTLFDSGAMQDSLTHGRLIIVADVRSDPRTCASAEAFEQFGARALVNVPVFERNRLVAVLYVHHDEVRQWSADEVAFIREVAERARTATARARGEQALRESEARLREANESLEAKVEARTRELMQAEQALRQSQKMEAVGQLTGGIAHDFNNLLQGITGGLDLIQRRIGQGRIGDLDRFIQGAMNSASRAAAMTHRLLAFSRRQPLDPRPLEVNPLIESMSDLLRRTLGERIELELALAVQPWLTRCDANQLESAILNLAINARDAMPAGGRLTIATSNLTLDAANRLDMQDAKPGDYLVVDVIDSGEGMSAETLAHAFEPFFTTKPIGRGTGLGLSMVYGFARQSGGFVKIDSDLGKGTRVRLWLPREEAVDRSVEAPETPEQSASSQAGETVLIVEDEAVVRNLIVELLGELGYRTLEASDGSQGLEILMSSRPIQLLITDVGLPGLNGRQIADAARQRRPELKILFMTAYAESAADAASFLESGMAMITKPFAMQALAEKVRAVLAGDAG